MVEYRFDGIHGYQDGSGGVLFYPFFIRLSFEHYSPYMEL